MTNMMAAMPIVGLERVVYYREQGSSTYNPWAFGLVASGIEIPYMVVQIVLFVCIYYPMVKYKATAGAARSSARALAPTVKLTHSPCQTGHFFFYLLMTFLSITFYTSFGQVWLPAVQRGCRDG